MLLKGSFEWTLSVALCGAYRAVRIVDRYFGEMALIGENKERSASIRTVAHCECYEILAEDFYRTVGRSDAAIKIAQRIEADQRAQLKELTTAEEPVDRGGKPQGKEKDFVVQKRSFVVHGACPYRVHMHSTDAEPEEASKKRRPPKGRSRRGSKA